MPQQLINLGAQPNDRTGDSARSAGAKMNANFTELYGATGAGGTSGGILVGGTTAQRPAVPVAGNFRWSTTLSAPEWFNGIAWFQPVPAGGGVLTGVYQFAGGSASAPSVAVGGVQAGLASLATNTFSLIAGQSEHLRLLATASTVNYWAMSGSVTGVPVQLLAQGADTNVSLVISAKGTGALMAQLPDSTVAGGNTRGTNAVDWQRVRAAATQVSSGSNSCISGGVNNTASGTASAIGGGDFNVADGTNSVVAGGSRASTRGTSGKSSFANGMFSVTGDCQAGGVVMRVSTTNATPTRLTTDGAGAASANVNALPNNSLYAFSAIVGARNTANNDSAAWQVSGLIKRGANAAATSLVGAVLVTPIAADAGASAWTVAVTADTTIGAINVTATGAAATTIRWGAVLSTMEIA